MGRGRRYDEPKLNMKKVFGVIITIAVIIMIIVSIRLILKKKIDPVAELAVTYYPVYADGKWGVINNKNEEVIAVSNAEMVVVPNKSRALFICIYDVNEPKTYKTKVLNEKNEQLFSNYERVEAIDNYDSRQNTWFENNVLRVYQNGKWGLIDFDGNTLLGCNYDEITALKTVTENFIVKQNGKVGLVNAKGQEIIKTEYKDIRVLKEGYKNEYLVVNDRDNYGVVSTSGSVILEPAYKEIRYLGSAENYAALINDKWSLIKRSGEVINDQYNFISIKGDNVVVEKEGKYGIIKTTGDEKISPTYDNLEYAFSVYYIAKQGDKYGLINIDNATIIPFDYINMYYYEEKTLLVGDLTLTESVIFDSNLAQKLKGIFVFENDYIIARVDGQNKYYNYGFEEKQNKDLLVKNTLFVSEQNGKYGFVDAAGNVVIDYIYDEAKEQNEAGYAAVKQNGKWGCIDRGGQLILEPSVDLTNNLYVDFVGKWHLSDDGYYTK